MTRKTTWGAMLVAVPISACGGKGDAVQPPQVPGSLVDVALRNRRLDDVLFPESTQALTLMGGGAAWSISQSAQKWLPVNAAAQRACAPARPPRLAA